MLPTPADPIALPVTPPPVSGPARVEFSEAAGLTSVIPAAEAHSRLRRRRPRRIPLIKRLWQGVATGFASLGAVIGDAVRRIRSAEKRHDRTLARRIIGATPAWLVSVIVHSTLFLFMGWIAVETHKQVQEEMVIAMAPAENFEDEIFAETRGEQLEVPGITSGENAGDFDPTYAMSELPEVDDPLSAPAKSLELVGEGSSFFSEIDATSIGNALTGRQEGRKDALLKAYGGTVTTQESVTLALAWLARQQQRDGSWSLSEPYSDGSSRDNPLAATAMAMIAFQGDGHTHLKGGPFRRNVQRGLTALLKRQADNGAFVADDASSTHLLYTQALCTIALCELYGISEDSEIRDAAQQAVDYCVKIQSPEGGWKYVPGSQADTSVTGWFAMALQSARMARLDVPSPALGRIGDFLDSVSSHEGSRYAYEPDRGEDEVMTAEALLCRQYLGWKRDDSRLTAGVAYVAEHPINWQDKNVYYWYYATQVMHHMGGPQWVEWNRVMRQEIPEHQVRNGKERGSWDPTNDRWGGGAGRLYVTCLSTYMLEVYYRHLPLYSHGASPDASESESTESAASASTAEL